MAPARRRIAATFASLLSLAPLVGCVAAPDDPLAASEQPIVGGTPTSVGQYPNVVALLLGNSLCTGTLVAPNVVVTAAHCVDPAEAGVPSQADVTAQTTVVFDSIDVRQNGGKGIAAASTLGQPQFDVNNLGQHDIGVVVLAQRVTDRQPAPIVRNAGQVPAGGATVTLVGYGISQVVNGQAVNTSAGAENVLANKSTIACSDIGGSDFDLICFDQRDGKGSCNGDSGGPAFLVVNGVNTLAGVTSFGDQQCVQIGAYTRLTAELAFLEQQMNAAGACNADTICTPACGAGALPADPDCSGNGGGGGGGGGSPTTPPPSGGGNNGENPGTPDDEPEIGDPPGLSGGCSVAPARGHLAADTASLALLGIAFAAFLARRVRRRHTARTR